MLSRIRIAIGLSLLLTFIVFSRAFAKGDYAFITIAGPNLKNIVRSTDLALTTDFFAFADFYQDKSKTPENPGVGYEITRYYIRVGSETPFDKLHYYPSTGFVHYDGIVNGSSEYDGKWYTANPKIKSAFESALGITITPSPQPQSLFPFVAPSVIAVGLVVLSFLAYRNRRSFAH